MHTSLLDRLAQDVESVEPEAAFTQTYFAFLRYFQELPLIEAQHVIISANFTYGWMPRMLRLRNTHFDEAAAILNQARANGPLADNNLQALIDLMNRSIVGVSKLLHFVNPQEFAILDRWVAAYLYPTMSYYQSQPIPTYRLYLQTCREICEQDAFEPLHRAINLKVGRPVSPLRAIELIMYSKSRSAAQEKRAPTGRPPEL